MQLQQKNYLGNKNLFFQENYKVSADNIWMRENLNFYPVIYSDEILTIFKLGGQSTYPYFNTLKLFYFHEGLIPFSKVLIKKVISFFLTKKAYFKLIAKLRSFEYYEDKR